MKISNSQLNYFFSLLSEENKIFVYELILKLLPVEDEELSPQEISDILEAKKEIEKKETVSFESINWN